MKKFLISLVLSGLVVGCGRDEDSGSKVVYLPVCCEGRVAANPEALLMCKDDAGGERSSIIVKKDAPGMIQTMKEMDFLTCE